MSKLLIITPTLGTSRFLHETVQSVSQLRMNFLHVLVCPANCVESLRNTYPGLTVLSEPVNSLGMYSAINHALIEYSMNYDFSLILMMTI